jgi:hypothetical protein
MTPDPMPIPGTGARSDIVADPTSEWERYCEYDDCVHSRAVAEIKRLRAEAWALAQDLAFMTAEVDKFAGENYEQYCEIEQLRAALNYEVDAEYITQRRQAPGSKDAQREW